MKIINRLQWPTWAALGMAGIAWATPTALWLQAGLTVVAVITAALDLTRPARRRARTQATRR